MPNITIELTETQIKGLESVALSPSDWANNVVTERARVAIDDIVTLYTNKALNEGVQIPSTREEIVSDAFARSWAKTIAQQDAKISPENGA
jgi:hypothetical protein